MTASATVKAGVETSQMVCRVTEIAQAFRRTGSDGDHCPAASALPTVSRRISPAARHASRRSPKRTTTVAA